MILEANSLFRICDGHTVFMVILKCIFHIIPFTLLQLPDGLNQKRLVPNKM